MDCKASYSASHTLSLFTSNKSACMYCTFHLNLDRGVPRWLNTWDQNRLAFRELCGAGNDVDINLRSNKESEMNRIEDNYTREKQTVNNLERLHRQRQGVLKAVTFQDSVVISVQHFQPEHISSMLIWTYTAHWPGPIIYFFRTHSALPQMPIFTT